MRITAKHILNQMIREESKVGDIMCIDFRGAMYQCKILEIKKNVAMVEIKHKGKPLKKQVEIYKLKKLERI